MSPGQLTNCFAWYTASAITPQSDGTTLALWPDSSGNGRDLAQGTDANRPTYEVGYDGSSPAVFSDGTSNVLLTASLYNTGIAAGDFTMFAVVKPTNVSSYRTILSHGTYRPLFGLNAGVVDYYSSTDHNFATAISTDTWYVLILRRTSGVVTLRINGVQDANTFSGETFDWSAGGDGDLRVFADTAAGGEPFVGAMRDVSLYTRSITTTEAAKIEQWASVRYGIAIVPT